MPEHTLSHAGSLFFGSAYKRKHRNAKRGIQMMPLYRHDIGAPATASANAHCLSQSVTGGVAALLNGALAGTNDVPRALQMAWTTTAVLTITGTDMYGEPMVEVTASGTAHTGKKAFKTITSIVPSVSITLFTAGTLDVLGLPYRLAGKHDVLAVYADTTQEAATTTVVAADTATPTGTTGDVRGTVDPATAANGAVVFRVWFKVHDPDSQEGTFGKAQYAG